MTDPAGCVPWRGRDCGVFVPEKVKISQPPRPGPPTSGGAGGVRGIGGGRRLFHSRQYRPEFPSYPQSRIRHVLAGMCQRRARCRSIRIRHVPTVGGVSPQHPPIGRLFLDRRSHATPLAGMCERRSGQVVFVASGAAVVSFIGYSTYPRTPQTVDFFISQLLNL